MFEREIEENWEGKDKKKKRKKNLKKRETRGVLEKKVESIWFDHFYSNNFI